jgi:2,3-bisphosphoglycerate-dependent phosphoglycerate mutase
MQTRALVLALSLVLAVTSLANGGPEVTTVILARHGEKAGPSGDVPLSDEGIARANELARVLTGVKFDAIYTTPYERTRKTAAPVAELAGDKVIEIATGKTYAEEMAKIIREKHEGDTVLVVGHSNTTRDIIKALGGDIPEIADTQYDDLFVVTMVKGTTKVLSLRYGAVKR